MNNSNVVENNLPHADAVLSELLSLRAVLQDLIKHISPYSMQEVKLPLAKFLSQSTLNIRSTLVPSFSTEYPNISSLVANGGSIIQSYSRLYEGIYAFGNIQLDLVARKCVLRCDEDRQAFLTRVEDVLADINIYTCIQFGLNNLENGAQLCVKSYCERAGISADILYGSLLEELDAIGAEPYGYETLSPYYTALCEIDETFLTECEDAHLQLSADISKALVSGAITLEQARLKMAKCETEQIEKDVEVTPMSLLKHMELN